MQINVLEHTHTYMHKLTQIHRPLVVAKPIEGAIVLLPSYPRPRTS